MEDIISCFPENVSSLSSLMKCLMISKLTLEKLNGSNFLDWYRNLRIVLGYEQKLHHLEEALPEAPPATTTVVVRNAYTCSVVEQHEIACLKLASMTPKIQKNLEDRTAFVALISLSPIGSRDLAYNSYDPNPDGHVGRVSSS
ncbi:hypothetical protein Tco_1446027 [Tanacetum coccineum]